MLPYLGLQAAMTIGQAFQVLGLICVMAVFAFFGRLCQIRMMVRRAQRDYDVPMMPHSFLFGHMISAAKLMMKYKIPSDHPGQWMFHFIKIEYPHIAEQGLVYLDPWPIGFPIIAVFDPALMSQFTQDQSLPKWWEQGHRGFKHFTGAKDIVHAEGKEWKELRSIFNPGFALRNILALVPSFIDEVQVFRQCLDKAAESGDTIQFRQLTSNLTVDVVSRAVLGVRLNTQTKPNKLIALMRKQLRLLYIQLELAKQLSPTRHIKHWIYNRGIQNELMPLIRVTAQNYEKIEGPKTIVALALKSYVEEVQSYSERGSIPAEFLDKIVQNIKMFMFAGHDTTSTTLSYLFYLLSRHPDKLAVLRAEHTSVLGPDPAAAASLISRDPTLLNSLPYTSAAIRETLRLFPPVGGTIRQSPPGHFLMRQPIAVGVPPRYYPTYGFILHSSASTLGRDEELYGPDAQCFRPERWLLLSSSEEKKKKSNVADTMTGEEGGQGQQQPTSSWLPPRGAFRPFEVGPRNCIGQELAQLEIRLVMALTAREYEIEEQYAEGAPTNPWGDRAYQINSPDNVANTLIKDGLPVVVRRAGKGSEDGVKG